MNVRILQLLEGAAKARGITVIIDVFRAFSVEAYLLAGGAEKIIPLAALEQSYRCKEAHPEVLLVGERHGKMCEGFDFGNSPSQIEGADLRGKTVVHTTSAGTQGLFGAKNAEVILGASLVNAKATAEYIKNSGFDEVSLVCMGLEAATETEEDTLCARYIKALLEGDCIDMEKEIDSLRFTSGAKFFDPEQNDVFPRPDFDLCTKLDRFDFAMRFGDGEMRRV